jgi:hypothetical protein
MQAIKPPTVRLSRDPLLTQGYPASLKSIKLFKVIERYAERPSARQPPSRSTKTVSHGAQWSSPSPRCARTDLLQIAHCHREVIAKRDRGCQIALCRREVIAKRDRGRQLKSVEDVGRRLKARLQVRSLLRDVPTIQTVKMNESVSRSKKRSFPHFADIYGGKGPRCFDEYDPGSKSRKIHSRKNLSLITFNVDFEEVNFSLHKIFPNAGKRHNLPPALNIAKASRSMPEGYLLDQGR